MKYLFSFLIISFLLTLVAPLSFAQQDQDVPKAPETLEEAKTLGERILWGFPEALKKPWQEALAVWRKMLNWFKGFWRSFIAPLFRNIWYKINFFLGREIEKRKPEIREELEKEKQEIKEEIPEAGKSLWQRFKELIK